MASGPFVKVYQSIVDDPDMAEVYADDRLLATWLRLLLVADAMYPVSAPLFGRGASVDRLVALGLVSVLPGRRYTIRGLASERTKRSNAGRNGAAMRWQSGRNADPLLAEQSRAEQSRPGRNAPDRSPSEAVAALHNGQHPGCAVCAPLRTAVGE